MRCTIWTTFLNDIFPSVTINVNMSSIWSQTVWIQLSSFTSPYPSPIYVKLKWTILHFQLLIALYFSTLLHNNTTDNENSLFLRNAQIPFASDPAGSTSGCRVRVKHQPCHWEWQWAINIKIPVKIGIARKNWNALKLKTQSILLHLLQFHLQLGTFLFSMLPPPPSQRIQNNHFHTTKRIP